MRVPKQLKSQRHFGGYDAVRAAVAIILLFAAGMKAYQLATEPTIETDILSSRWFLTTMAAGEFCFGLFLLTGSASELAWVIMLACFGVFSAVSAYKGLSGGASCGCFGILQVNPWFTCSIDFVITTLLLLFPPPPGIHRVARYLLPVWLAALLAVVVGVPVTVAIFSFRPASIAANGEILSEGSWVVFFSEQWEGKRLPLLPHIDVGRKLAKGRWAVVLYHRACPQCHELIERIRSTIVGADPHAENTRVALIEVPQANRASDTSWTPPSNCLSGRLDSSRAWFVSTPAVLSTTDGVVREVCREPTVEACYRLICRCGYPKPCRDNVATDYSNANLKGGCRVANDSQVPSDER